MNKNRLLRRCSGVEGCWAFLDAVIVFLVISLIASVIFAGFEEGSYGREIASFIINIVIQLGFFFSAYQPNRFFNSHHTYTFTRPKLKQVLQGFVIAILSVAFFEAIALAFNYMLVSVGYINKSFINMSSALAIVFLVIQAVIFAPVCEEVLMRGSLLSSLGVMGKISEKWRTVFMVITSGVFFALLHMNPMQTVYQFLFGATLAYVTIRTGNIMTAVFAHAFNNTIGIVLSVPVIDNGITAWIGGVFESGFAYLWVIISLLLVGVGFFVIRKVCRLFGKRTPEIIMREENGKEHSENGGTMGGIILLVVAVAICVTMWISVCVTSFIQA